MHTLTITWTEQSPTEFLSLLSMIRKVSIIILLAISTGLYAQKQDTTKHRVVRQMKLSADYAEEINTPVDTVFSLFHRYRFADKYSIMNAMLGNYGLPFYQLNFFDRITDPDKFLYSYYYPLMYVPDKAIFMNTQVPYTELIWTNGGAKETSEQTFRVRHSQNVNRFFNFGLIYDIVYSLGQYSYQRAEDKTATIYTSYTNKKYKLYFSAGINNIINLENGGISSEAVLGSGNTRDVPVKLGGNNKATSTLKDWNVLLVQRYVVGGNKVVKKDTATGLTSTTGTGLSGTFSHILTYEKIRRSYTDQFPTSGFYDTTYISDSETHDTLAMKILKNTVRFDFATSETGKFRLGGGFGIRNEIIRYNQLVATGLTYPDPDSVMKYWSRGNNAVVGRLFNSIGEKFRWTASGELFLTGYRAGDFDLNGVITKSFDFKKGRATWDITGGIANREPSFWYSQWGGNNFEWSKSMKKEFRVDLGSVISYPARKINLRFNYAVIKNYTDFDSTAMPSQYTGGLSVASLSVSKGMRAWKFHLDPEVIVQQSTNKDILDLPLAAVRAAAYFEHRFLFRKTNGKLNIQLGVDATYNTPYYAYAYMPATGRFYRQYITQEGAYPYVNFFLNFKLQRTRAFVMFDHINYGKMGSAFDKKYIMVPDYPMNITMFRFGLAWTFYN
jgi:hypothetical protein